MEIYLPGLLVAALHCGEDVMFSSIDSEKKLKLHLNKEIVLSFTRKLPNSCFIEPCKTLSNVINVIFI